VPEYGHHFTAPAAPDVGEAPLTYAIGDIHGSLQKLRELMTLCRRHADGRPATFIFFGDYIDRGPDSRGVVEALIELQSRQPDRVITLKGNHEAVAVEVVDGDTDPQTWLREGGTATLRSYRVDDGATFRLSTSPGCGCFRSATTMVSVFSFTPALIPTSRSTRKATAISFGSESRFCRTRATMDA